MTDFDAIAQGMTQAVPFAGHLGLEITSIGEGEAVVLLPERQELTNHVGSQHAGALFTVAETASGAAWSALCRAMGDVAGRERGGTTRSRGRRDLLRKDRQGPIEATAKLGVAKDAALATLDAEGKVEFPCEVLMTDASGLQVASATIHWHVRLNKPAGAAA